MEETKSTRTVTVRSKSGLHLRPAHRFVKLAQQYDARVEVVKDSLRVDGKRILDITMLGAEAGTELLIEAVGHDAEAVIEALVDLVEHRLPQEDETSSCEDTPESRPGE